MAVPWFLLTNAEQRLTSSLTGLLIAAVPLVGALLITGLAEGMRELMLQLGIDVPGVKQVFYGVCLLLVVMFLPDGVWPPLARKLKL